MAFRIGQKVVCVDDVFASRHYPGYEAWPTKNIVYTIRDIYNEDFEDGWATALLLEEIINPFYDWLTLGNHEAGFSARRFRPVVEKKTDISIFTKMLDSVSREVQEV